MNRTTLLVVAALLLAVTNRGPAAAADNQVPRLAPLVLVGQQAPEQRQQRLLQRLWSRALVHSTEQGAWLLEMFPQFDSELHEQELLEQVGELAARGRKAYQYLKLEQARAAFARAARLLRDNPPAGCQRHSLAEMYLYWARTELDSGNEAKARRLLQQVIRLDPTSGPDPTVMPPNLVATFDIAIEDRQSLPQGRLLVEAGPAQVHLAADCLSQPSGVVELKGLQGQPLWLVGQGGWHNVRVEVEFRAGPRQRVRIFEPLSADIAALEQDLAALRATQFSLAELQVGPNALLDRLARRLEVQLLMLVAPAPGSEGRLQAALYLPGKGIAGEVQDIGLDERGNPEDASLAAALQVLAAQATTPTIQAALAQAASAATREGPGVRAGGGTAVGQQRQEAAPAAPWYQSWWFWTAVGVVVAGGVTGGVLAATLSGGESPSGKVILTVSPP